MRGEGNLPEVSGPESTGVGALKVKSLLGGTNPDDILLRVLSGVPGFWTVGCPGTGAGVSPEFALQGHTVCME